MEKGVHLLAVVFEDQVPLAKGAATQVLDRVHPAGVVLHEGYQLLVDGPLVGQVMQCLPGHAVPDGQPRAHVAVEGNGLFERNFAFLRHDYLLRPAIGPFELDIARNSVALTYSSRCRPEVQD